MVLAYTDVRGAQARLAVARDNVANQESASELTQQLLKAGRGTQLDVDRAIALLESTRASIPPLLAAESSAIYRLGVLVGSEPQALAAELRVPATVPPPPEALAIGEPVTLLRRRPDVAAAESAVLAAAARAGVAAAELFPRLVLTGGVGVQALASATSTIKGCALVSASASRCRFSNGTAFVSESWPPMRPPRSRSRPMSEPRCRARRSRARDRRLRAGAGTVRPSRSRGPIRARGRRSRAAAISARRRQLPDRA